jgi:hypothetical protein
MFFDWFIFKQEKVLDWVFKQNKVC